MEKYSDPSKY